MVKQKKHTPAVHPLFQISDGIFSLIFCLGIFLRFFRLSENMYLSGEIGDNLLTIKNAYLTHAIPLIGPPTSHPWLNFGPFFYWIYGPILVISHFNPLSHAYFGAVVASLVLPLHYFVIKKISNTRIALLSAGFIAISPLYLEFAHFARFFSIIAILIYPFIYFLYRVINGEKRFLFWLAFIYGCMFSFHFSPLMLLPFVVSMLIIKKIKLSMRDVLSIVVGFVVPMLPFFIYDTQHGLQMTTKIILWIPYRVAGFFGLVHKNTVSTEVLHENTTSVMAFFEKSFVPYGFLFILGIFLLIVALYVVVAHSKDLRRRFPINDSLLFLAVWFVWGLLAVSIHGAPPIHYFLPILPLPILLVSLLLDYLFRTNAGRVLAALFFLVIAWVNVHYYFSPQWYYMPKSGDWSQRDVPYELQVKVAKTIIKDANGEKFVLHRIGVNDQFSGDYAQNYMYLLWLYGNEPVDQAENAYVIVEDPSRIGGRYAGATKFLHSGNIIIFKIPTVLLPKEEHISFLMGE